MQYKEIKLIEGIKTDSQYGKNSVNFGEMKELLKNFMKRGKPTMNKLKC